ncbi:IS110 family transposase [Gemmatimonadota bacterium]
MNDTTISSTPSTIGMDLGDRFSHLCIVDVDGEIIEESRLTTSTASFTKRFERIDPIRICIEACVHSPWVSRLLSGFGHEVVVANPRRMRLIYMNDTKNDRVDAEFLARIGRMDPALLSPIRHRGAETMADRSLIKSRDLLVRTRTKMIIHVRGMVKHTGHRVPSAWTKKFAVKVRAFIPAELRPALYPIIDEIEKINEQIRAYEARIEELARTRYPETAVLTQINGVGLLTALTFILTIEDPYRFSKSRQVSSYLGLRPKQYDSGSRQLQMPITKAGDSLCRKYIVQCANHILGPFGKESDLRTWGLKLMERGGKAARKRAIVAVARKLSILMHRLWITGEVYEPVGYGQNLNNVAA